MTDHPADRELEAARARLHAENMAAIRAARAAVDQFTAHKWRRVRCPVCQRVTIVVRGILAAHPPHDAAPFNCPGSGAPPPPEGGQP